MSVANFNATIYGYLESTNPGDTWANIWAGAGMMGVGVNQGYDPSAIIRGSPPTIRRGEIFFDTSTLEGLMGSGHILSATIALNTSMAFSDSGSDLPGINIYPVTPITTANMSGGDFTAFNFSTPASVAMSYAAWVLATPGFAIFTLTPAGIASINLTGISTFGFAEANYDAANSPPPDWTDGGGGSVYIDFDVDISTVPILWVRYGDEETFIPRAIWL